MKKIVFLAAIAAFNAGAVQIDASIGQATYTKSNNGDWWQEGPASEGFYDNFNLRSTSYSIGITDMFAPSWRWRVGYANLGRVSSLAYATTDDATYNLQLKRCNLGCQFQYYIGSGEVDGIYATLAKEVDIGGFTLYAEAGAWLYRAQFKMQTTAGGLHDTFDSKDVYEVGPVFGFGVGRKNTSVAMTFRRADRNGQFPAIYQGYTQTLELRHRF